MAREGVCQSFKVLVLETGGTIGRVGKLLRRIKISSVQITVANIMSKTSSDMRPDDWMLIGKMVLGACEAGCDGIVVTHGTDTLAYTAAALSFMIQELPIPVVLTGSVIPGNYPNSDAANNLRNSIITAISDLAEVCVVFSDSEIGNDGLIIRGTRSREIRSTKLNAFASINSPPLGAVRRDRVVLSSHIRFRKRSDCRPRLSAAFDSSVSLIKFHPSISVEHVAGTLKGSSGAVVEGYGSGRILSDAKILEAFHRFPGPIALTKQGIVYDYGGAELRPEIKAVKSDRVVIQSLISRLITRVIPQRSVLSIPNIIPVRDMLAEVALVKLMWILGNRWDPRVMLKNCCGEISS